MRCSIVMMMMLHVCVCVVFKLGIVTLAEWMAVERTLASGGATANYNAAIDLRFVRRRSVSGRMRLGWSRIRHVRAC